MIAEQRMRCFMPRDGFEDREFHVVLCYLLVVITYISETCSAVSPDSLSAAPKPSNAGGQILVTW